MPRRPLDMIPGPGTYQIHEMLEEHGGNPHITKGGFISNEGIS